MDISFGHFLWETIVVFFWVTFLIIFINVVVDIFRSHDLSGIAKAVWVFICFVVPVIGVLIYVIVRGGGMAERAVNRRMKDAEQFRAAMGAAGPGSPAEQIADAKALLEAGTISQEEFEALKAKALA